MKKFPLQLSLALGMLLFCTSAWANPQQVAVAKRAVLTGKVSPYATPELKRLIARADQVVDEVLDTTGSLCDFAEKFYLGHSTGDWDTVTQDVKNAKITIPQANTIRMTIKSSSSNHLIEFTMVGNQIYDIKHAFNDGGMPPKKATHSLRARAKKMVEIDDCVFY